MLELFQSVQEHPTAHRMPPEFEYIKGMYLRELLSLQEYYHHRVYAVKNQNLLVRILTHIDTPMSYDADRFVEVTRARVPYISKAFKLTSEIDYGSNHPGAFFGQGNNEFIIYEDSYFDPYYAEKNWKRISAVKTILHPRSDLGFMLPNGKESSTDKGLAVISINLPLLALQMRAFFREQIARQNDQGLLGISHFVHMYILPNMMYLHADVVILNRMMNLFYGYGMGSSLFKHAFKIIDYSEKLDNVLVKLISDYSHRSMKYDDLLTIIPSFSQKNCAYSLQLPNTVPTRQVWWLLMLSRLQVMKFLIDLGGPVSVRSNQSSINQLQRDLKRLKREHVFEEVLPIEIYESVQNLIEELLLI